MKIPPLTIVESKKHWNHYDVFGLGEDKYIKSFVHKNYRIGYHTHSFYELNIVISGEGYHYIEKMSCHASRGCVFLIPPHIRHGYENKNGLNVHHMLIHREFLENCFDEFRKDEGFFLLFETEPYLRAHYNENMFPVLNDAQLHQIMQDTDLIKSCEDMNCANIYINAIAKKILCTLCMLMTVGYGIRDSRITRNKELLNIADCLNYIHRSYDEKLTVDILSQRLNMSRSAFIRHFTKICGCPPHQYIHNYRLKKAEEYLKEGYMTTTEIAHKCGFYDASHLQKHLRRQP